VKIVFLNIWHGKCRDELAAFIDHEKSSTDIFCFQEADPETREYLSPLLSEFAGHSYDKSFEGRIRFTLATYVKKPLVVDAEYTLLAGVSDAGAVLMTHVQATGTSLQVVNVHGISFPDSDDKLDTDGRIEQSRTIIEALRGVKGPVVIGGDFNLLPEARSIRLFAQAGYRDLIDDYHVTTTRNKLAWERFPDNVQYYADYVFVGSNAKVRSFSVPQIEASDHLPLIVDVARADAEHAQSVPASAHPAYDHL